MKDGPNIPTMKNDASPLNPDTLDLALSRPAVKEMTTEELNTWMEIRWNPFDDDAPVGSVIQCMKVAEDKWVVTGTGID